MSSNSNKSVISECTHLTMNNRKKWITDNVPSIDEIFSEFSRFGDYFGQMIDEEFDRMYKGASDKFLAKFSTFYVFRILILQHDNLRAIILLAHLLPVRNSVRKRKKKDININIETSIEKIKGRSVNYFIQADNQTLILSKNSSVIVLDLMFKIYYVFNVRYSKTLINFFSFSENYFFQISSKIAHGLVSSTHINISNIIPISQA
ncbi:hypothetical protein P5V15_014034 [Pogonomyrmex californicus]